MADIIETFADGTIVERDFTKEELAQIEKDKAAQIAKQAEAQAKESAKLAILNRIGLTADELQTILG